MPSAPANMMMPKREPPAAVLPLLLQQGVELNPKEEGTGKVVAASPVPRAAPSLRVEDHCSVEGLVDPPRDLVRPVQDTRSVGSTLASEATQERKVARVRDTSKTSVTHGGVSFDTRALADITLVKVSVLKGINAIMLMSKLLKNREGTSPRGSILLTKSRRPILGQRVNNVVTHHIQIRVLRGM